MCRNDNIKNHNCLILKNIDTMVVFFIKQNKFSAYIK